MKRQSLRGTAINHRYLLSPTPLVQLFHYDGVVSSHYGSLPMLKLGMATLNTNATLGRSIEDTPTTQQLRFSNVRQSFGHDPGVLRSIASLCRHDTLFISTNNGLSTCGQSEDLLARNPRGDPPQQTFSPDKRRSADCVQLGIIR